MSEDKITREPAVDDASASVLNSQQPVVAIQGPAEVPQKLWRNGPDFSAYNFVDRPASDATEDGPVRFNTRTGGFERFK